MALRYHPRQGPSMLASRAMVHQCKPLFGACPNSAQIDALRARLQRLRKHQPQNITPRHAFVSALAGQARAWKAEGRPMHRFAIRTIFQKHGARWRAQSLLGRAQFGPAAERLRQSSIDKRKALRAKIKGQIATLEKEREKLFKQGEASVCLGMCRLSETDVARFNTFCEGMEHGRDMISDSRKRAVALVGDPPESRKKFLQSLSQRGPAPEGGPLWQSVAAANRNEFMDTVWKFHVDGVDRYFMFVFALQSPALVCFSECYLQEDVPEPWLGAEVYQDAQLHVWRWTFTWGSTSFVFSDDALLRDATNVMVLHDVSRGRGGSLHSDADWLSISRVCFWYRSETDAPDRARARAAAPDIVWEPHMTEEFMWEHIRDAVKLPRPARGPGAPGADREEAGSITLADDALDDLWDVRADVGADGDREDPFYLTVRGGKWLLEHHGVAYDGYRGQARAGPPCDFCLASGMGKSCTLSAEACGDETAVTIVQFWIARMTFFYTRWLHDAGAPVDWEEVARQFVEPAEIVRLCDTGAPVVRHRITGIRRKVPFAGV